VAISDDGWTEKVVPVPAKLAHATLDVTVRALGNDEFGSAHYWIYGAGNDGAAP
jgi:hypothetical protein